MSRVLQRITKHRKGAVLVEFALVFPLFLAVLFATIDVAMFLNGKIVVMTAAREGGRAAAVADSNAGYQKAKKLLQDSGYSPTGANISVNVSGNEVYSRVSYPVHLITPGFPALIGGDAWANTVTVTGSAIFRKEQ